MKNLVIITAQHEENYGFFNDVVVDNWKPKGEQLFTLRADVEAFMYAKEQAIAAFKTLLASQSNNLDRYTYVSHELVFCEPIELSEADFEAQVEIECEKGQ
jgi:hypothetical protein